MSSNDRGGNYFDVVNAADQPLYSGSENHSQLSAVARLVNIKSEHNLPQSCYDEISQLIGELLPRDHTLPKDYYSTKKLIRELGLPVEKIDACKAGCMLFWKDDKHLEFCKFCGHARYKPIKGQKPHRKRSAYATLRYLPITPRLQRLYANTAEHMSWHATHETENGVMCHPSDAEAWKYFDDTHPNFAIKPVMFVLAFVLMVLPLMDNMANHILVGQLLLRHTTFLQGCPLIEELVQLWQVGHPYRRNKKAFTKGRVEKNEAPPRSNGEEVWHSVRYFKSAIEDPVSYLMVMELSTSGQKEGKTKDNLNARKDVEIICDRPEIANSGDRLGKMTKAVYTLDRDQKRKNFEWIKALRFPDGYTSNLGRCIDLNELKLHGMKSHDCHVFMERLIPTAFREMLPEFVWNALTEKKVKNKAAIEASICEAYIVEEISTFTTHYFEPDVVCKKRRPGRNDDGLNNKKIQHMSIFNHLGRPHGASKMRTKARRTVESRRIETAFQEDEVEFVQIVTTENEIQPLHDINVIANDIEEEEEEEEDSSDEDEQEEEEDSSDEDEDDDDDYY
ncbi:UNVERIFIED_CONTAM: hypothetical protein Scaly_0053600 [Sesamum calycinum]|uniref:DUF4218 domain-containing protein n=1 Tax=Sesamum calycinum TaxID=2727403 RepID=A0AAW2SV62_9LAMI